MIDAFNSWLFEVNKNIFVSAIQRAIVAFAGSALVAYAFLATDTKIRDANADHLYFQIFSLLILAPLIENILLVLAIELIATSKLSFPWISLFAATVLGGLHSLFSPVWGVVVFWPFYIFGATYLGGRKFGRKKAYILSALVHGIHNTPPAVMLFYT